MQGAANRKELQAKRKEPIDLEIRQLTDVAHVIQYVLVACDIHLLLFIDGSYLAGCQGGCSCKSMWA
jgi:hypothetical protein